MSSHLSNDAPPVTRILAEFVATHARGEFPEVTRAESVRTFVNWLGCAIGGAAHPAAAIIVEALGPHGGAGRFAVPGLREGADLFNAALLQGVTSHVFDFDDTHLRTIVHPAGPVLSALMPLAQDIGADGERVLDAMIVGIEVECRVANAIYPAHYDRGWHITGTTGVLGAAAACARLLGLSAAQTLNALGIAATQSSGFREMFGSMCKSFHVGAAARNGLQAALLARKGFTSSTRAIEAPRGLANVMSTERDYDEITRDLGRTWEIDVNSYKPFACGIVIHPAIDACVRLSQSLRIPPEEIEAIRLDVHPLVLELTGTRAPNVGLQGKFSVYHAAAAGYLFHRAGEDEFSDEAVRDPKLVALRDRITAEVRPGIRGDEVFARLITRSGGTHDIHVPHAIGSAANPMTDTALDAKFEDLARPVLGEAGARAALRQGRGISSSASILAILDATRPQATAAVAG